MDSRNNFINNMKKLINLIDEEYLINICNKGTLNRSKKDLEKMGVVSFSINDDNIEFKFDDIKCNITDNIQNYKCSCPSRIVCKHIIMSYLYLIQNKDKIFKDNNLCENLQKNNKIIEQNNFDKIKNYNIEMLIKEIGEKNFSSIINRLDFGVQYTIKEDSIINVDYYEEGINVKLLEDIKNSVCSCNSKDMCIHKAEAIILYKLHKKIITKEELKNYDSKLKIVNLQLIKKATKEIRSVIENILIGGLARININILHDINRTSVICHNCNMPNLEKNLRDIKYEMSLYFSKNASFTKEKLLSKLTNMYTKVSILENTKDKTKIAQIIGEFKSSYNQIPAITLYGIGQEKWSTKSGYEGITYYFYENNKGILLTYTNALPVFYDNENLKQVKDRAPWNLNCEIEDLAKMSFKLFKGKINSENRLSKSSESNAIIMDKSDLSKLNIDKYLFYNWEKLFSQKIKGGNKKENDNLVFLKGNDFGKALFDNITQIFYLDLYDEEENDIKIAIEFSKSTKKVIKSLETLSQKEPPIFLARVYISHGNLMFYPIVYYVDNEIYSLS